MEKIITKQQRRRNRIKVSIFGWVCFIASFIVLFREDLLSTEATPLLLSIFLCIVGAIVSTIVGLFIYIVIHHWWCWVTEIKKEEIEA